MGGFCRPGHIWRPCFCVGHVDWEVCVSVCVFVCVCMCMCVIFVCVCVLFAATTLFCGSRRLQSVLCFSLWWPCFCAGHVNWEACACVYSECVCFSLWQPCFCAGHVDWVVCACVVYVCVLFMATMLLWGSCQLRSVCVCAYVCVCMCVLSLWWPHFFASHVNWELSCVSLYGDHAFVRVMCTEKYIYVRVTWTEKCLVYLFMVTMLLCGSCRLRSMCVCSLCLCVFS